MRAVPDGDSFQQAIEFVKEKSINFLQYYAVAIDQFSSQ